MAHVQVCADLDALLDGAAELVVRAATDSITTRHAFTLVLALSPAFAQAQSAGPEQNLPEVNVRGEAERADGPVDGYRATRSGTFTRTDTPLKEVPASVTVVPAQVMKDAAMQSMGDMFRYVPGTLMHQGEGNRDQIILRGP